MAGNLLTKSPSYFYYRKCHQLAKSLIIKSYSTAQVMNQEINNYYLDRGIRQPLLEHEKPRNEWRYFKHLHGEYHSFDLLKYGGEIEILSLDTYENIKLNKETMNAHRATFKHFQEQGEYYKQCIEKYPDLYVLINGIINPIDYEKAIDAEDWSILGWNKNLVGKHEISLMDDLAKMVSQSVKRFHARGYVAFDPNFDAVKLGVLATQLPGMIIAIREQYVGTLQAHIYHIKNHLASFYRLDQYVDILDEEQLHWLYRHIRSIHKNAGSTRVFDALIEYLLTHKNIPIYRYDMDADKFIREGLNPNANDGNNHRIKTIDDFFEREDGLSGRNGQFRSGYVEGAEDTYSRSRLKHRQTKLHETEVIDYSARERQLVTSTNIYYWTYLACTDKYKVVISISHPVTGEKISMNAKDGLILWLYSVMKIANSDYDHDFRPTKEINIDNQMIPSLMAKDILNPQVNWHKLLKEKIKPNVDIKRMMQDHVINYPVYNLVYSTERFKMLVEEVVRFYKRQHSWEFIYEDYEIYKEAKMFNESLKHQYAFDLVDSPTSFRRYLENINWEVTDLSKKQLTQLMVQLYSQFTGQDNVQTSDVNEIQKQMVELLKRLSSYTIQFVSQFSAIKTRRLDLNFLRVGVLRGHGKHLVKIYNKFYPKYSGWLGKEHGSIDDAYNIKSMVAIDDSHEYNHRLIQPIGMPAPSGLSDTRHRLRFIHPRYKVERTPLKAIRHSDYYIYNNTLYKWRSWEHGIVETDVNSTIVSIGDADALEYLDDRQFLLEPTVDESGNLI